ncbi:hypothetical protein KR093_000733 [Drosophila rubida]|uniref:C-type lectin domain-containing protein n=1 Tax=Drosophila rubida TaxID=30044 RepID=A0AAD4K445_9MUSC|nr:hypothetical protein KR093_000733 [Drosophila rubida]
MLEHIGMMQRRWEECDTQKLVTASARLDKIEGQLKTIEANEVETNQKLSAQQLLIEKSKKNSLYPFEKIGSGYYYIEHMQKDNWFGAAHKCRQLGGHLISLDNREEVQAIVNKLDEDQVYWTDISDLSEENVFISLSTGRGAKFLNWRDGEPNNAKHIEHCITLVAANMQMNDIECTEKRLFICETNDE